jgi:hypothetical protein
VSRSVEVVEKKGERERERAGKRKRRVRYALEVTVLGSKKQKH